MNINKVILVGRVTKSPDIKKLESGSVVANFNLATNLVYKTKQGEKVENTEFHRIVVWGKQAEIVEKYVVSGQEVGITGRIQTRTYDKSEDCKMKITEIICDSVSLGSKPKNKEGYSSDEGSTGKVNNQEEFSPEQDDLPF